MQTNMVVLLMKNLADSEYFKKNANEKGNPSLVAVSLDGVTEITIHSKKNLLIVRPGVNVSKGDYLNDLFSPKAKDLKKGDEEILIRGWLTDEAHESAWNKLWKLRAMTTSGGPLNSLEIDNIHFEMYLGTYEKTDPVAWLVDVSGTLSPNDTGSPYWTWENVGGEKGKGGPGDQVGRIEVSLKIIIARVQ